tara:strand:+ start:1755 stop:2180 length:426 start_codon:yes stop_codon:yes gene_type:complete
MTLDELKKLVEKDLPINDNHLDTESLRSQELYAKYSDIKTKFEFLVFKAKSEQKILYKNKWEYYSGRSDAKVYREKPFDLKILKADLSIYIDADEEMIDATNKILYLETIIKYCDSILKSITSRGWDIKNAIEWRKFEAGK